jgi:integrase
MRHSSGGVRKQRGRWFGLWYEDGIKKSTVLGSVKDMTKNQAREAVAQLVASKRQSGNPSRFGAFVEGPYFQFYRRKWKASTAYNTQQRITMHLVTPYRDRDLASFTRDELQNLLDDTTEGLLGRNPALLLFTPKAAKKPVHCVMTSADVRRVFAVLGLRERIIAKFAILSGLRPGEIFALTWAHIATGSANVSQRVYRGLLDSPKTHHSVRQAALTTGLLADLEEWRALSSDGDPSSWVFPSERGTTLRKENVWRRNMLSKLQAVGLGWANFQVMRRTHATLMRELKADPKMVADQLGHTVDVSLNVYAQSPVEGRILLVNELERFVVQ